MSVNEENLLPHVPMEFTCINEKAFDFGFCGTAAIATSHLVNFSYFLNKQLKMAYSISPSNSQVTCLKFNPRNPTVVICTADGSLFLYDSENRNYLGFILERNESNKIVDVLWYSNTIIVLYEKKTLACYSYSTSSQTKTKFNISLNWSIQLPISYNSMSIDVISNSRIILSSTKEKKFQIFDLEKKQFTSNPVHLNSNSGINDAQFSYHIPGYMFILMETELLLYDEKNQTIVPVFRTERAGICYTRIYQLINDHSRLFLLTKAGSAVALKVNHPFEVVEDNEFNCPSHNLRISAACTSTYDDSVMLFLVQPMGICLFDLERNTIKGIVPLNSSKVVAASSNTKYIVTGMNNGTVVVRDLYNHEKQMNFRVSETSVNYVCICEESNDIVWLSSSEFGTIDLEKRIITKNVSKPNVTKALVSKKGAILVQRSASALGIIINNREYPLIMNQQAIDFCFNEKECVPTEGSFMVLTDQGELHFFKYSMHGIGSPFLRLRPFGAAGQATSITWCGDVFATGTQLGTVSMMNLKTGTVKAFSPVQGPITSIKIVDNRVLGIGKSKLFSGPTDVQVSPFYVDRFDTCSDNEKNSHLICSYNGYAFFVSQNGFKLLSDRCKSDSTPPQSAFIEERLKNDMHTSPEARDLIFALKGKPCLRTMIKGCIGETKKISEIELGLAKLSRKRSEVFKALLFVNEIEAAGDIMLESDEKSNDYLFNAALGAAALSLVDAKEKQKEKIVKSAKKLISVGKYEEGSIMLRMAGADEEGFRLFMSKNNISNGLKFARLMNDDEKKRNLLFEAGSLLVSDGKFTDSALLFIAAKEGHAALFSIFSLGNILDCFVAKKLLKDLGMLNEISEDKKSSLRPIDLSDMNSIIDTEFQNICKKMNLSI